MQRLVTVQQSDMLALASLLVQAGANIHAASRPDTIWGIEEMEGTSTTPVQMARDTPHTDKLCLLRVLFGFGHSSAVPLCECCGDEFILCCNSLQPPMPACGHQCCFDTVTGWIISQADGGAQSDMIGCPVCLTALGEHTVRTYLQRAGETSTIDRLTRRSLDTALNKLSGFVWCPRCPSGGIASDRCDEAICADCGYQFCKVCKQNWNGHQGLSCSELQESDAGKTMAWVEQHTRQCPKCAVGIVHDGGCSHMTCQMCKYQFCWLCMGPYKDKYTMEPTALFDKAQDKEVRCPCGNPVRITLFNRTR